MYKTTIALECCVGFCEYSDSIVKLPSVSVWDNYMISACTNIGQYLQYMQDSQFIDISHNVYRTTYIR